MNGGTMNRRTLIIIASIAAGVLVLAGAGTWGGVAYATTSTQHDLAVVNASLAKSYRSDTAVVKQLTADRVAASKLVASARPLVATTDGLAAREARTALSAALDTLARTAEKPDIAQLTRRPIEPRDGGLAAVQQAVSKAKAASRRNTNLARENTSAREVLGKAVTSVYAALTAVAKTAGATSAAVLASNPKADPALRDVFAAQAVTVGKATGKQAIAALTDYAAKGKAVIDSQVAAVAAEAEKSRQATTPPGRSSTDSPPMPQSPGNVGHPATGSPESPASHGSGGGSGGTPPPPGDTNTPPVSHTPDVVTNGTLNKGCDGTFAYSQTTSSGGTIVINVDYPYTYTTFPTADGWGVSVYACI